MIERIKQKISESKEACNYNPLTRVIPSADILEIVEQEKEKPQTNADRIRNMTDDELAVNMMCPNENGLAEIDCDKNDNCNCYECLLKWLRAESEE